MTTQIWNTGDIPVFTIGDRLRKARELTGLSQGDFAAEIDISPRSVSNYESEAVAPKRLVLKAWAMRTGVPFEWIVNGDINPGNDGISVKDCYPFSRVLQMVS